MHVPGLLVIVVLYGAVLVVGVGAARWFRRRHQRDGEDAVDQREMNIVAARKLGGVVGIFTMTGWWRPFIP